MKKFLLGILCSVVFATGSAFAACSSNQIDAGTNGCKPVKFSLTTSATNTFSFSLSAKGTFYVDCGNGGTLSGTGASGNTITRTDTTDATYTCSWNNNIAHIIGFGGTATDYSTSETTAAIGFYTNASNVWKITAISGNLSSMFPYISGNAQNGAQPRFYQTFYYTYRLTNIPGTLFADYTTPATHMFDQTFTLSGVGTIPSELFSRITGTADSLFFGTFASARSLTSIPAGLFAGITGAAKVLFHQTFSGCTNLSGYIPPSTFAGLIANGSPTASNMWGSTFNNTALVTTCPSGTTEYYTGYKTAWNGKVSCDNSGAKFILTTTATNTFIFGLTAKGTFYVNCGDGGTLKQSSSTISNNTITHTDTSEATYYCSWNSSTAHIIKFSGTATDYNTATNTAAIKFSSSANKIASISGNLSSIFPYISGNAQSGAQPRFVGTFSDASNLVNIPDTLFADYTTPATYMFWSTFFRCTSLTSIPSGLFSRITGSAEYLFDETFHTCTGLTSLPAGLFSGITNGASNMFYYTFYNCANLSGYIPPSTFAGLIANGSPTASNMWGVTFTGTKLVTTCPGGTVEYNTGYKTIWDGKVSCFTGGESRTCAVGQYLPKMQEICFACPVGNACSGGTYQTSASSDQGIAVCSGNTYAATTGLSSCTSCPSGYTISGATAIDHDEISDCQRTCNAGYAVLTANGACSAVTTANKFTDAHSVPYGSTSELYDCYTENGYGNSGSSASNHAGESSCKATCAAGTSVFYEYGPCEEIYSGYYRSGGTETVPMGSVGTVQACHDLSTDYLESDNGRDSASDCYLTTVPGAYVSTAYGNLTGCTANGYCPGNVKVYYGSTGGRTACPVTAPFAPEGMTSADQCGRKMHIGDDILYLRSVKQTTPSLNVQIGNTVFYGNMTTTRTTMNKDTNRYFHAQWGNNDYYVCDDTTYLDTAVPPLDLTTLDPTVAGTNYTYDESNKTWSTTFSDGTLYGTALCSQTAAEYQTVGTPDETTTGVGCWCKVTGYTLDGKSTRGTVTPSIWATIGYAPTPEECISSCAEGCGMIVMDEYSSEYRAALYGISQ